MANYLMIGGHGKVALLASKILSDEGHTVTSIIRDPNQSNAVSATGAVPLVLDIETASTEDMTDAMRGQDAIIWSAGAGGGNPARTRAVDLEAAKTSMEAAKAAGVARYIMVSYLHSSLDHGVPETEPFYTYAQAKAEADEHLKHSGLDYTILGPGTLTLDEPTGKIDVLDKRAPGPAKTSRANVALTIAAALRNPSSIGKTIGYSDGQTPIDEAIA